MASLSVVLSAASTFKHPKELKISRELIDFGFCILQTPQLTSAQSFSFPLWLGIVSFGLGVLLCLTIIAAALGLLLVAFGIFMLLRRHHVVLSGSDGRIYAIVTPNEQFAIQIVDRLRSVMLRPAETPTYVINIKAEKIQAGTLVDVSETSISGSHGAAIVKGATGGVTTSAQIGETRDHRPSRPQDWGGGFEEVDAGAAAGVSIFGSHGPAINTGTVYGSVSTHAQVASAEIAQGLDALIVLIERNNVAHQEQLAQMLQFIRQQHAAGPAGELKARETWASFAQYAFNYLSGVEGMMGLVERMQRLFR